MPTNEAAILTADMVGFSARMRADQDTVISLLLGTYYRLALEAAQRFDGQVFRREGDAIWCSFTTPQAAIEAGLWLLSGLTVHNAKSGTHKQIRIRVGVAWGPVVTDSQSAPSGAVLNLAKRLENTASVGTLQIPSELLTSVPAHRVLIISQTSLDGLSVTTLQASPAYEKEIAEKRRPRSSSAWVFALDFSQVSGVDVHEWLRWAVQATQTRGAQVYEWQEHHHLLIWPASPTIEPWPGAATDRLPFPPVPGLRCSITQGDVINASLASEGLEGPSLVGATVERALELLELAPTEPGLWCEPQVSQRLGSRWSWTKGHDRQGQEVWARQPAPPMEAAQEQAPGPRGPLDALARALSSSQGAVILCGGGIPEESAYALKELGAPIFAHSEGPGRILLDHPDVAWQGCAADPHWDAILRRGELLWICFPGEEEWLKLLYADFDYRFSNHRPGILIHSDWDEREKRRWHRRGFILMEVTEGGLKESVNQLIVLTSFHRQVRHQERQLSRLPSRPYKFLNYFNREDRSIFFGRESEIERIKKRLLSGPLLVLFGKSGVGKTSLVRAGLLSHFQAPHDMVFTMRTLSEPLGTLRSLLSRMLGLEAGVDPQGPQRSLADLFAIAESRVTGRIILAIDQFEEYFLRCTSAQRCHFEDELAGLVGRDLRRTHLILSLREDFLGSMAELQHAVPEILRQRFRISALTREQARSAILGPARLFQLEIAENVVEDLLDQLDQGGIEPPQLQIVLDRLYDQRSPDNRITWEVYQQAGGAQTLLRHYFEEALQSSLGPEGPPFSGEGAAWGQKERARQVLKRMVSKRGTKVVVTVEELQAVLDWPRENLAAVLKLLVESRLVRSWQDEGRGSYELTHDFLTQEIARWETPQEIALKHAASVVSNEMRNFQKLGVLMPADRLQMIQEQASLLALGRAERAMLIRASIARGLDPAPWITQEDTGLDVLLQLLDEGAVDEVARTIILVMCRGPLDEVAARRMLVAARQFGNPHLLVQLRAIPAELSRGLQAAVRERFFGSAAMALVPAGPAWVGSTREVKEARKARLRPDLHARIDSEWDYHRVELEAFHIDRLLVSNAAYCEFRPAHRHFFPPDEHNFPAVNVSFEEAEEYARWLGKRLPSEEQWEKAARGEDGRLFPWGNEFDATRVNSAESGQRVPTPVDAYPLGASPYGCLNMAGNVWEWTTTPWEPDQPLMAKKGGCALNFEPHMHVSARFEEPPEMRLRWAGFRLIS